MALGRLGGAKGGPARAKALSARRRSQIAARAATARARSMSASERRDLARKAAAARWAVRPSIATAGDAPPHVRRLLGRYRPSSLRWNKPEHRYVIVREILLRGSARARGWLHGLLAPRDVRSLVRLYGAAGCTGPERLKLRQLLGLSARDIPLAQLELRSSPSP